MSCDLDMRSNYATTEAEITSTFQALDRVRLHYLEFLAKTCAELKDLSMVSQPEAEAMLADRIQEAVCEGLSLTVDAQHYVFDSRE